jgi:hypothetical protein
MAPKVFVSHASEDKDRFVLGFATELRARGVDVWLDKWEMLPGDSLVDKIFEEGIKGASAVIVVLSKFSVQKPWVREELNAAFVRRVNSGSKLIPVIIDECDVPEALSSTLWQRIEDLVSYPASLDRIVAAIFGATDKPPLGPAPKYSTAFVSSVGGLNNIDSLVLKLACEDALKTGRAFINPGKVYLENGDHLVPESELSDSLEVLDQQGYIKLSRTIGPGIHHFQVTNYGFETFARSCIPEYDRAVADLVSAIVNKQILSNAELEQELGQPRMLVDTILHLLESNGLIALSKMIGGLQRIYNVSPTLKRSLKG